MANKYYRKATDREREASVALYKFFESFAKLTEEDGESNAWYIIIDDAVELARQYPECKYTIMGIVTDISDRAKENSNG